MISEGLLRSTCSIGMAFDRTIHIVDDDRAILDSLILLLTAEGLRVRTYELAQTSLETIRQNDFGCVVTDVRMPEISGLDLLAALKKQHVSMPVIVMTAHGDIPLAVAAMRQGAVDFFEKPFNGDLLLAAIRLALRREDPPDAATGVIQERLATLSKRDGKCWRDCSRGSRISSSRIISASAREPSKSTAPM